MISTMKPPRREQFGSYIKSSHFIPYGKFVLYRRF